jgi:hypothetical protein
MSRTSRRLHIAQRPLRLFYRDSLIQHSMNYPLGRPPNGRAVAALAHRRRKHVLLRFMVVGELLLEVMDTGATIQERGVG